MSEKGVLLVSDWHLIDLYKLWHMSVYLRVKHHPSIYHTLIVYPQNDEEFSSGRIALVRCDTLLGVHIYSIDLTSRNY